MSDHSERTTLVERVRCLECGRAWLEKSERWRVYLNGENPPRPLTYCPECAQREFD